MLALSEITLKVAGYSFYSLDGRNLTRRFCVYQQDLFPYSYKIDQRVFQNQKEKRGNMEKRMGGVAVRRHTHIYFVSRLYSLYHLRQVTSLIQDNNPQSLLFIYLKLLNQIIELHDQNDFTFAPFYQLPTNCFSDKIQQEAHTGISKRVL